jgi:PAS domain S-box-containing protein
MGPKEPTDTMVTHQSDIVRRASEQRYRHLFESVPICIFVADLAATPATILDANRRAGLVFGYAAAELAGMPVTQLTPNDARPVILAVAQRVQQGEAVTDETTGRRRDGTLFPVRVIAAPDPADASHMIVTVEDISAEMGRRSEAEAIDAERRRIAHEIHDGVAQSLAGVRFKLALWQQTAGVPPAMGAALGELHDVLTAAIVDLRRAIVDLRPMDLDGLGFLPALAQLVGDFGDQNQVAARLEVTGQPDGLPPAYELPLFRVIQESLNNIGQHAGASSALVTLTVDEVGVVAVAVCDNGRGFDPRQLGPVPKGDGHFGLRQMRERILDLGGTLDIHSSAGQGTKLVITLPPVGRENNHATH